MKYQYQVVAANNEYETLAIYFNHRHLGWLSIPKPEVKNFVKTLKARYKNQGNSITEGVVTQKGSL